MEGKSRWMIITAFAPIVWGATYFVTRSVLPAEYPLYGAVLRALPAGLILLVAAHARPRGSWWIKSAVLGALNFGAFFVLVYVSAQLLPSSIAATLMALSASMMMLAAWPLLGETPRVLAVAGAIVGFGGVCLIMLPGSDATMPNPIGLAASVGAMLMSSLGYVLTTRWSRGANTPGVLALTSWQLIAGGVLVLPVAILTEGHFPALDGPALLGFGFVTIIATALAFWAWFTGLRHLSAATVGLIGLLNPVTGVALGTIVAGETLGIIQACGVVMVLTAIVLPQLRRSRQLPRPRQLRQPPQLPGSAGAARRTVKLAPPRRL